MKQTSPFANHPAATRGRFFFLSKNIKSSTKHLLLLLGKCKESGVSGAFLTDGQMKESEY